MKEMITITLIFIAVVGIYLSIMFFILYRLEKAREDKMLANMIKAIKIYEMQKEDKKDD